MRPLWQTATGDMMPTSQACGFKVEGNNNGRMMLVTGTEMNDAMIGAMIDVTKMRKSVRTRVYMCVHAFIQSHKISRA